MSLRLIQGELKFKLGCHVEVFNPSMESIVLLNV